MFECHVLIKNFNFTNKNNQCHFPGKKKSTISQSKSGHLLGPLLGNKVGFRNSTGFRNSGFRNYSSDSETISFIRGQSSFSDTPRSAGGL